MSLSSHSSKVEMWVMARRLVLSLACTHQATCGFIVHSNLGIHVCDGTQAGAELDVCPSPTCGFIVHTAQRVHTDMVVTVSNGSCMFLYYLELNNIYLC